MAAELKGQTAIVTGGARGIGRGIVRRLAEEGCRVAVWDLDPSPLANGVEPAVGHVAAVDVTSPDSIERALRETEAAIGSVAILVNNAGVNGPTLPFWDYPVEDWDRVLAVDLKGVFLCSRALAPGMRARGYGRIVNIASVAGKEGNANSSAYCAAKAGVIGLTKSMAKGLIADGVLVNAIAPAMSETDLLNEMSEAYIADVKSRMPMGRLCTVEEIADMVCWVASPRCSFTTGQVFDVSGGRADH